MLNITLAQIPEYIQRDGLIGWWPFNGNANDESGNDNHGFVSNAVLTTDVNERDNSAYYFDGQKSKIEVNAKDRFQFQEFTFSFWLFPENNYSENGTLIGKSNWYDATSETFGIGIEKGRLWLYTKNLSLCRPWYGWNERFNSSMQTDFYWKWHHITITVTKDTCKLFLNGMLYDSKTNSSPLDMCPNGQLKFGAWWSQYPNWFKGKLDDIAIWNRVLSESDIKRNLYKDNIKVFPNPVSESDFVNIRVFIPPSTKANIRCTDLLGRQLELIQIEKSESFREIDVPLMIGKLLNGTYFIFLEVNNDILSSKFIINR
jgi:hypothetical protein